MSEQPKGTVTFLFTDVEDHTRLWEIHPAEMSRSLARHDEILRDVIERCDGYVFSTAGDAFSAAFSTVDAAATAAIGAQQALRSEAWPSGCELRVRMGLHTGEAEQRDGDYFGPAVIRAARLMSLGHGGQILTSGAVAGLLEDRTDQGAILRPLGDVVLRGLGRAERVHELRYPGLDEEFPALVAHVKRAGNLPAVADRLIGRADAVSDAAALLGESSLVTFAGPGGVGKTRLAIEVASSLIGQFGDGVWFVPLASVTDAAAVPSAIAEVLGVQEAAARTLTESIVSAIAGRDLLLVLDNCEHVADGVRHVARSIVDDADRVTVMATSREPLGVAGERVLPVDPLPIDATWGVGTGPACELFVARASAADPGFRADGDALDAVQDICARLDGMPLALELAAARVRGLGLTGLRAHLDDRFRLLRARGAAHPRHRTLRATVGWSYDLLEDRLQELFCRAAVFAGGFTLDAAEEVLGFDELDALDVADGLAELVDKSMLQTEDSLSGRRYRMLETMRQFGAESTDAAGLEPTRARFVRHYSTFCASAEQALVGPHLGRILAQLRAEFDNLREALRLAVAIGEIDEAVSIVVPLHQFGIASVNAEPWVWAHDLLEYVPVDHPRFGDLLMMAVWGCRARGDRERAEELIAVFEGLESERALEPTAFSLNLLAATYWFFQHTDRSVELHERATAAARASGDTGTEGLDLASLSMTQDSFDRSAAERTALAAIELGRTVSSPLIMGNGLLALAGVVVHSEPERAIDIIDEEIEVAHAAGFLWAEAAGVRLKAHALSRAGRLTEASHTYVQALDLNGVGDFGELLWYSVLNIVEHLLRLGRPSAAAVAFGAWNVATAAPSDDLVARFRVRIRQAIESQLDGDLAALEAKGSSMRLAALINYLRAQLLDQPTT